MSDKVSNILLKINEQILDKQEKIIKEKNETKLKTNKETNEETNEETNKETNEEIEQNKLEIIKKINNDTEIVNNYKEKNKDAFTQTD